MNVKIRNWKDVLLILLLAISTPLIVDLKKVILGEKTFKDFVKEFKYPQKLFSLFGCILLIVFSVLFYLHVI